MLLLAVVCLLSARESLGATLWGATESDRIHFEDEESRTSHGGRGSPPAFSSNATSAYVRGTDADDRDRFDTRGDSGYGRADGGSRSQSPADTRPRDDHRGSGDAETERRPGGNASRTAKRRRLLPQTSCGVVLPRRILGGSEADIDEFPWLALLQYRDRSGKVSYDCSGALISSRYVITAAHCTVGIGVTRRKLRLEKVRLGEWDLSTDEDCQRDLCSAPVQDVDVEEIVNHDGYSPSGRSQANDVALLRLGTEARMTQFVQPICLPFERSPDLETKTFSVSGWGKTSNGRNSRSNVKMRAKVPGASREACAAFYDSFYGGLRIESSQICAGGEEGRDTCQGDSGGPLMSVEPVDGEFRWFALGIVSSGPAACGVEGRPSLYTNVADFADWIVDNVKD